MLLSTQVLLQKRARITPDRVDTPVNKPKRGRKVVTIVEEHEQDPKDEEKTSKIRGPKPFEKKESTEKVIESEIETEEAPKEEAKPSRKRGPKAKEIVEEVMVIEEPKETGKETASETNPRKRTAKAASKTTSEEVDIGRSTSISRFTRLSITTRMKTIE
jgi:hypothetical protein